MEGDDTHMADARSERSTPSAALHGDEEGMQPSKDQQQQQQQEEFKVYIPVQSTDENVVLTLSDLETIDPEDVFELLRAELAPLKIWLALAIGYYRIGKADIFVRLLEEGTSEEAESNLKGTKGERIAMLNTLGAHFTNLGMATLKEQQRQEYVRKAAFCFNRSDKIDLNEKLTWVGKGILLMMKNELDRAEVNFNAALNMDRNNIPALLGKARVLFARDKFNDALDTYRKVLRLNPQAPPAIRLGLGLCFHRLGRLDKARAAFERVLELEPENVHARIGLMVMAFNQHNDADTLQQGLQHLEEAWKHNHNSSMVLNHLANHFFFKGELAKVEAFARSAFHQTDVKRIKAESGYYLGRNKHFQGDLQAAMPYYEFAVKTWPEFSLAQYGLGQMCIHEKRIPEAIACFERILQHDPTNAEVLKVLASVCASVNDSAKAVEYFRRLTAAHTVKDPEVWVEIAQLNEGSNPKVALEAYITAQRLCAKRGSVPGELFNNIGCVHHRMSQFDQARSFYEKAYEALTPAEKRQPEGLTVTSKNVTVIYNLGRLDEVQHKDDSARDKYLAIIKEHPGYTAALLRLGTMHMNRGRYGEAARVFLDALAIDERNSEVLTHLAHLYMTVARQSPSEQKWKLAQSTVERLCTSHRRQNTDTVGVVMFANIFLTCAQRGQPTFPKHLTRSLEYCTHVLKKQPNNAAAAHGLGCVLAEAGHLSLAREIFFQMRESMPESRSLWVNMGHIHLLAEDAMPAIMLYNKANQRFHCNTSDELHLLVARAHFDAAMKMFNPNSPTTIQKKYLDELLRCLKSLQTALHLSPSDLALRSNLALVHWELAFHTMEVVRSLSVKAQGGNTANLSSSVSMQQLDEAEHRLQIALRVSSGIAAMELPGMGREFKLAALVKQNAEAALNRVGDYREFMKWYESHLQSKEAANQATHHEMMLAKLRQEEEQRANEEREQYLRHQQALEAARKTQDAIENAKKIIAQSSEVQTTKKPKKKSAAADDDAAFLNDGEITRAPKEKKKREKKKKRGDDDEDDEEPPVEPDSDDEAEKKKRKKEKKEKKREKKERKEREKKEREREEKEKEKGGRKTKRRRTVRELIGSDDDDDVPQSNANAGGDEEEEADIADDAGDNNSDASERKKKKKNRRLRRVVDDDDDEEMADDEEAQAEEETTTTSAKESARADRKRRVIADDDDEEEGGGGGGGGDDDDDEDVQAPQIEADEEEGDVWGETQQPAAAADWNATQQVADEMDE